MSVRSVFLGVVASLLATAPAAAADTVAPVVGAATFAAPANGELIVAEETPPVAEVATPVEGPAPVEEATPAEPEVIKKGKKEEGEEATIEKKDEKKPKEDKKK